MRSKSVRVIRHYSTKAKCLHYFTTPIYYVNANPHIGHLYSSLIADAAQRWQQLFSQGAKIKFATGTDEHGMKIQQASANNNSSPIKYCCFVSSQYKNLANKFSIQYTDFIRTTSEEHKNAVGVFWSTLDKNGHIYSSKYSGWYCISDETFLTESQLKELKTPEGQKIFVSAESGHPVEWTEEENYMFRLNSFQDDLQYWLSRNENIVRPKKFQKILLDLISAEGLPDISISRPTSRVHWGIRVPGDATQTVYVWLDALVNYLTVAGYSKSQKEFNSTWPPDVQVIGKDILKFHGVYWPAFLMAANLEPPRSILCHSHWTVDGEKMSKSKNNVVCPFNRSEIYTSDGLRYFLLREGVAHSDGNYSDTKVVRILNSELADTLGNLLSRCCGMALNPNQVFPQMEASAFESVASLDVTKKLIENVTTLPGICQQHYEDFNFYKVVDNVIATLHSANLFFETLKPWELKKNSGKMKELDVVLHVAMESLRISAILLQPIIPNITDALLNKLNIPKSERYFCNLSKKTWIDPEFRQIKLSEDKTVLFRRILSEESAKKLKSKR